MARPSKYNWDEIKIAYEGGLEKKSICDKFNITSKALSNKIHLELWEVKGNINDQIDEFKEVVKGISQNPESVQELIIEKINTQALDNELISNNRKLAKMLQSVVVSNRTSINLNNIKAVSGTLRDIEAMANPVSQKNETQVNVQTNVANNIKTLDDFYEA